MSDVTRLLDAVERGEPKAAEELLPLVYDELRRLAAAKMANEKPGQTLQATALVHEAWLRLGRDVVGQRTAVTVAKNRYGPPGRSVDLDIHYLGEGERMLAAHRLASDGAEATAEVSQPVSPAVLPSVGVSAPVRPTPRLVVA